MSLAEGVQARVTYKAYASGAITANAQAVSATDLAVTGGQVLRRTTCSLSLKKDTYQASEITSDRQVSDFRHGVKRVTGSINGELSPGTYFDLIEAACRGTKANALAFSEADFTSAAASNSGSTITFASGDPVASGMLVGMTLRFTNMSVAANNSTNFLVLAFGGTSNRTLTVYPAPTDQSADTAFNVVSVGKSVSVPSSSFISRKYGVEVYHSDIDVHRLFTECRVGGVKLALPSTGMATIEVPLMGRDMEDASGASSPFFTGPTAQTTTGLLAAVNGLIRVNGVNQGVITGAQVNLEMAMQADPVVGQNFVPEIFLGRAIATGQLTADFQDLTLVDLFKNETEIEVLMWLTASSAATADTMSIYMPRVKFGDAAVTIQGEGAQIITLPFTALKLGTATAGKAATTIQFCDSAA